MLLWRDDELILEKSDEILKKTEQITHIVTAVFFFKFCLQMLWSSDMHFWNIKLRLIWLSDHFVMLLSI